MISEIKSDERDSTEIPRDVVRPIGVTSPETLAGFGQIVQVVVQTEMTRARETEIRIARDMEAEMVRAIEIARDETERVRRDAEIAEQIRVGDQLRISEQVRVEAEKVQFAAAERIAEIARAEAERA